MAKKIFLSADSSVDIGPELAERYHVAFTPLSVYMGDTVGIDGVSIFPDDVYENWYKTHTLPRTAAVNPEEYLRLFQPHVDAGEAVIHISLGSGLSSCHQNARIAAEQLGGEVYVIDSKSLSTGSGLLVCEAGERIASGMEASKIYEEVSALADKTSASFVIDKLDFLHAGGRCSSMAQLSAGILGLHPSIFVVNDRGGSMTVGKKYVGKLGKCVTKYIEQQLAGRDDLVYDRVFVTHSGIDESILADAKAQVLALQPFKELFVTRASCTISSHCGPGTIGVLFIHK